MPAEANLQSQADFIKPLSIDFVEQFGLRLKSLYQLLGVERRIPMASGSVLKTYKSVVTLDNTKVAPGDVIPLSKVEFKEGPTKELVWTKRRKAAPVELIQSVGFDKAILQTDDKFKREIQKGIRDELFAQLKTGTGKATAVGLQATMAQAWGQVVTKFDEDDVSVITFINPLDAADYLGDAALTTQTAFGMNYLEGFLNNRVVMMHPSIPKGTIYATAAQNLVLAYVAMNGEVNKAFDFTTDETGIIGVTHDINKQRLTAETVAAFGICLFAEVLDGVIVGTIKPKATA